MGEHVTLVVLFTGVGALVVGLTLDCAMGKKRLTWRQKVTFGVVTLCVGGLFLVPVAHKGNRLASEIDKWQTYSGSIATGTSGNLPYLVTDAGYRVVTRSAQPYKAGTPIIRLSPQGLGRGLRAG